MLTLALGIGANTAIFSVVNAVLLRPLPYPAADRLVYMTEESASDAGPVRRPAMDVQTLAEFRAHTRALAAVAVQESVTVTMAHGSETVRLGASRLSPAYLSMLGVRPALGRTFQADAGQGGSEAVVLLGYAAWQKYFGGAPDVVGRQVQLDGRGYPSSA